MMEEIMTKIRKFGDSWIFWQAWMIMLDVTFLIA